jgi:hypothetical protein
MCQLVGAPRGVSDHPSTMARPRTQSDGCGVSQCRFDRRRTLSVGSGSRECRTDRAHCSFSATRQSGHSVPRFDSVPRFLKKFGSQKIGTDRFPKNLGTDDFGSRLFWFGFGSNQNFPA